MGMIQADDPAGAAPRFAHDLFISYAAEDKAWVDGFLIPALGDGPRIITAADFQPGFELDEYQRAIKDSRYTVLVVTSTYVSNMWAPSLEAFVTTLSMKERQERLVPLIRTTDSLTLNLQARVQVPCRTPEECEEAVTRLLGWLEVPEPAPLVILCPYLGAQEYPWPEDERSTSPDRQRLGYAFFGRQVEIRRLAHLMQWQRRIFVIGSSGVGKSSLINAGLVPYLRNKEVKEGWLVRRVLPGEPGKTLLEMLADVLAGDLTQLENRVKTLLERAHKRRLSLIIDSYERVFTQAARAEQQRFVEALDSLYALDTCTVIIIARADFYHKLLESGVLSGKHGEQFNVEPLQDDGLRSAIVEPARAVGVMVAPELVERLVADCRHLPGALPLLQATLQLLWHERQHRYLPLQPYLDMSRGQENSVGRRTYRSGGRRLQQFDEGTKAHRPACLSGPHSVWRQGRSDPRHTSPPAPVAAARQPGDAC